MPHCKLAAELDPVLEVSDVAHHPARERRVLGHVGRVRGAGTLRYRSLQAQSDSMAVPLRNRQSVGQEDVAGTLNGGPQALEELLEVVGHRRREHGGG